MSHSRCSKLHATTHTMGPTPPSLPKHRVGDLLWCRENKKRYSLWWPAMVTYEPHQAILVRTTPRGIHQVHVQYFGISAVRGWVSQLQYEPLVDTASRKLPTVTIGKKMKCEFEVAIREATEALRLTHKERKLKFIFNFDPLPSTPTTEVLVKSEGAEEGGGRRGEGTMSVKAEVVEEARVSPVKRGDLETTLDKRRKNKRRRNSASCSLSTTSLRMERNEVPLSVRTTSRRRRVRSCSGSGGDAAKNFVVSLPFNGLGKPSGSAPSLLIGESPVTMDSFAVTVDKVLNEACAAGGERDSKRFPEKPPNGMVVSPPAPMRRGPGRPRKKLHLQTKLPTRCSSREEGNEGEEGRGARGV